MSELRAQFQDQIARWNNILLNPSEEEVKGAAAERRAAERRAAGDAQPAPAAAGGAPVAVRAGVGSAGVGSAEEGSAEEGSAEDWDVAAQVTVKLASKGAPRAPEGLVGTTPPAGLDRLVTGVDGMGFDPSRAGAGDAGEPGIDQMMSSAKADAAEQSIDRINQFLQRKKHAVALKKAERDGRLMAVVGREHARPRSQEGPLSRSGSRAGSRRRAGRSGGGGEGSGGVGGGGGTMMVALPKLAR
jgi:hypothetical protein